ncbi:hypothetical protein SSPS47_28115 [Streptomyces sp. S4.7]|nr:hypothetical protein SSPS47_28115 [Streptomyces sp. S4.7]
MALLPTSGPVPAALRYVAGLLDVDVDQLARRGPLVPPDRLADGDGRARTAGFTPCRARMRCTLAVAAPGSGVGEDGSHVRSAVGTVALMPGRVFRRLRSAGTDVQSGITSGRPALGPAGPGPLPGPGPAFLAVLPWEHGAGLIDADRRSGGQRGRTGTSPADQRVSAGQSPLEPGAEPGVAGREVRPRAAAGRLIFRVGRPGRPGADPAVTQLCDRPGRIAGRACGSGEFGDQVRDRLAAAGVERHLFPYVQPCLRTAQMTHQVDDTVQFVGLERENPLVVTEREG